VLELAGLLPRVAPDLEPVVYVTAVAAAHIRETQPWAGDVRVITLPGDPSDRRPQRIAADLGLLPLRVRRDGVRVLHSLANFGPPVCPVPQVLTVHDLLFHHFPSTHPGIARHLLGGLTRVCVRRADAIGVPSRFTAQDLEHTLGVPAKKLRVIHQGGGMPRAGAGDAQRARAKLGLGKRRVVLAFGVGFEHKNIGRLVDAFARIGPPRDAVLVVVGSPIFEGRRWAEHAREIGLGDRVVWPSLDGFVDDQTVEDLFAAADLLVHPSLLEGFGLPPLEAMSRGVPVACSRAGSLPEVAGDAAEYFDPYDVPAMGEAIARVLDDPARAAQMVVRGRAQSGRFTWEENARRYAQLYREVAATAGARRT